MLETGIVHWNNRCREGYAGAGGEGTARTMEGPSSHWEEKHHVLILGGSEIIHFAVSVP